MRSVTELQGKTRPPVRRTAAGVVLYSIGAASAKLGVHPRTLMAWERIGLVSPVRRSTRRRYSDDELRWLECAQAFNRDGGISLHGISALLRFVPCWAIREQIESGEGVCCPPAYPAQQGLERVRGAYAGSAPRECRSCGVYLSNVEPCGAALERQREREGTA